MMNGLYGKTIQNPILDESKIVWLHEELIYKISHQIWWGDNEIIK